MSCGNNIVSNYFNCFNCWIWILMVALTHWVCFLFFGRGQLRFWPLVSLWYFGGSFVWVAFLFAGEWCDLWGMCGVLMCGVTCGE